MISRSDAILRGTDTECESGCRNERNNDGRNDGMKHDNNNDRNGCYDRSTSVRKEDPYVAQRSQSNCRAPLVGWQNGSPTICLSFLQQSVVDLPDGSVGSSPSKSCNIREISLTDTTEPMERSDAANKIQEVTGITFEGSTVVAKTIDKTVGTGMNPRRVKDSIDSLSISELGKNSSSFVARESKGNDREKAKVPDGGWGWVVVLASLIISMVADGISFSFGLLYIEFLHEFGASKSKTAWIGSLFMAVPLLSGPIMSALVDRYGCRNMTIAGGLISGLGFILSIFSNTIEIMFVTFGFIAGLGLGMCYVTAVVSIAFWFDKKRTLAVGLGACGTGIGTFIYAPMTAYFIKEYGWRGTCLLLAGTFFNMIVAGAVMRDPEWWILEQRKQEQALPKKSHGRSDGSSSDEFPGVEELRKLLRSDHAPQYFLQNLSTSTKAVDGAKRQTTSVVNLPTFVKRSEKVRQRGLGETRGKDR